ncbi:hypothetical protein LMTR3_15345 [Bradyrhizobium sp. LMTR 3]|nr:hypothetical protein LMTR3_15345 [Bradyrhizobium sp. LMTR 3]
MQRWNRRIVLHAKWGGAGRFAAVTPPAMTLLLSTSLTSDAIAASGNNGYGNGGGDGSPNGKDDKYR